MANQNDMNVSSADKEAEIAKRLSTMEAKVEDSNALAKLLADPDVRQLLDAKQKGNKIKIVDANEPELNLGNSLDNTELVLPDLDEMSNRDLAKHVIKEVSNRFDVLVAKKLTPVIEQLKTLGSYVEGKEAQSVGQQIESARKKYQDFDSFIPEMKNLNKDNPGLSIEELYMIVRTRKGAGQEQHLNTDTERPSQSSARAKESSDKKPMKSGRGGFQERLAETLESLQIET